jgi:branched-chain amino acid transport system substrate-binding protein
MAQYRPAAADIVIGLAYPMAGTPAARSVAARRTVEAAVANLNAKGGVNGEKVEIEAVDDGCDDATARIAARTLIDRGVQLVIGHPCEKAALAAAEVYGEAGTLFIAPDARHPAFTSRRSLPTVLRLAGREDRQGDAAVSWLIAQGSGARFAIVQDRTAYARTLTASVVAGLKARGIAEPLVVPIVAGEKDYTVAARSVAAFKADAVLFAGYPSEMDVVHAALRTSGIAVPILGSDALATTEFSGMGAARDERLRVLVRYPSEMSDDAKEAAAVALWAEAARQVGSTNAQDIAALMKKTAIRTDALGWVSFDERGDARIPAFVPARWKDGRWTADGSP